MGRCTLRLRPVYYQLLHLIATSTHRPSPGSFIDVILLTTPRTLHLSFSDAGGDSVFGKAA